MDVRFKNQSFLMQSKILPFSKLGHILPPNCISKETSDFSKKKITKWCVNALKEAGPVTVKNTAMRIVQRQLRELKIKFYRRFSFLATPRLQ